MDSSRYDISTVGFSPIHINKKIRACSSSHEKLNKNGFIYSKKGGFWFLAKRLDGFIVTFFCAIRDEDGAVDLFIAPPSLLTDDPCKAGYSFGDEKWRLHWQEMMADPDTSTDLWFKLNKIRTLFEKEIERLQDAKIIEGHVEGEWI